MAKKTNNRKKPGVNARGQWSLTTRVLLHFFVFVSAGVFFGLINQFMADPFGGLSPNVRAFWRNSGPMLLALTCLSPIFVWDTLTLSSRIAGPIHRLKDRMKQITRGESDLQPMEFGDKDMWDDLPEVFNEMVAHLQASAPLVSSTRESLAPEIIHQNTEQHLAQV